MPLSVGQYYVFYVFLDEQTDRIAASAKLNDFLSEEAEELETGTKVDLLICAQTDMGFKAVINDSYLGLIFKNEIFQPLRVGQKLKGLIKNIRDDGKIDLGLQVSAEKTRDELSDRIIEFLSQQGGTSTLTDKSPPNDIYNQFSVSKGSYKKALGQLFRQKLILIEKSKITLL
jgi:predicted RNA-binding protein (virulence factor B family)